MLNTILCLLPVLVLAVPLLARRYPGERVLIALRGDRQAHWPRARSSAPVHRRVVLLSARGGLLIGRSLAGRPPPALTSAS